MTPADLDGLPDGDTVRHHVRPVPPSLGAGEGVEDARARLDGAEAAWLVRDGRVAGLVTRAAIGLAPSD